MRFSTIAAFATSLAVVSAQTLDLSNVPDCAVTCLVASIPGSGCSVTDTKCQCTTGRTYITNSLESCVPSHCSTSDSAKVIPAVVGICSSAGISVAVPTSLATAVASAASSVVTSAASSASAAVSGAKSSAASVVSSAKSHAASATSSGASAASSAAAQSTGGATANAAGLGAVGLGMIAALL